MLARTRRAASENGATLVGDERSGHFSHQMVRGQYCRQGRTVIVTITDKHWLLPWGVVERQLRSWFGSRSLPGDREESAGGTTRLAGGRRGVAGLYTVADEYHLVGEHLFLQEGRPAVRG
jgi:hypothetical protein